MPPALRLQGITLPVPDLAAAEKFYRWVLAMKAAEGTDPREIALGWGKEDRVRLIDAAAPGAREVLEFRMQACDPPALADRLAGVDLAPTRVVTFEDDRHEAEVTWPEAEILGDPDPEGANRFVVSLESPAAVRIDLHVPLPAATVVARGRHGPFHRRSKDWSGLENPGVLGVTLGADDPRSLASFLTPLEIGILEDDDDPDPPFLVGDHQLRIEERDPPGIYGLAVVVAASRLPDLVRTLERFGVQHRLDRNHLLAVDPAGRILAVNGVRSG